MGDQEKLPAPDAIREAVYAYLPTDGSAVRWASIRAGVACEALVQLDQLDREKALLKALREMRDDGAVVCTDAGWARSVAGTRNDKAAAFMDLVREAGPLPTGLLACSGELASAMPKAPEGALYGPTLHRLSDRPRWVCVTADGEPVWWWKDDERWAPSGPETAKQILRAWAMHEREVAEAERAARKAEENVWLGAIGAEVAPHDEARIDALRQARRVTHDALRRLGREP